MSIPILFLAYKRPKNTYEIITRLGTTQKIYIFVDHDNYESALNTSVKAYAEELSGNENISVRIESENLGPGKAMIAALDWVFESEDQVWILEDDVFPNSFSKNYIALVSAEMNARSNLIATSRSSNRNNDIQAPSQIGLSKYPLTNGWVLSRNIWLHFKIHADSTLFKEFLSFSLRKPYAIRIEHFYFFAAALASRKEITQAWDTQFAFFCLLNDIKTLTPDKSCIEIRGMDQVASNTIPNQKTSDEVFWKADTTSPSNEISYRKDIADFYDTSIRKEIYCIKWWHIFSPIKCCLIILKKRFINFKHF